MVSSSFVRPPKTAANPLLERTLLGIATLPWLLTLLAAYLLALPVPALVRQGRDIFIQPHAVVRGIAVSVALALACFTAIGAATALIWQTRSRYAATSLALCGLFLGAVVAICLRAA